MKSLLISLALLLFCVFIAAQPHYTHSQLGLSLKFGNIDKSRLDIHTTIADDFNNDRFEDVVKLDRASGMLNYYVNEGNGYLSQVKSLQVGKAESISLMVENAWTKNILISYSGNKSKIISSRELNSSQIENRQTYGLPFSSSTGGEFDFNEVYQSKGYQSFWNCVAGDIDNDGKNEVIFAGRPDTVFQCDSVRIFVYESAPNNTYVLDWDTVYRSGFQQTACLGLFAMTDIDNDGNKEICFVDLFYLKFIECYGPGQYKYFSSNILIYFTEGSPSIFKILEADVNHDNRKELLVNHVTTGIFNNPTKIFICTFANKSSTHFNFNIKRINVQFLAGDIDAGDINGDGRDEILLGGAGGPSDELYYFDSTGSNILWYGNGGAGYEFKTIYTGRNMGAAYSIARDLNGDGKKEWLCSAIGQGFGGFAVIRHIADSTFQVEYYDTTLYNALGTFIAKVDYNNEQFVFYPRTRRVPPNFIYHGYLHIYKYNNDFTFSRIYDKDFYPQIGIIGFMNILDIDTDNKLNIVQAKVTNEFLTYSRISDLENEYPIGIINYNTPVNFKLEQNYPNPFNPLTKIKYIIAKFAFVKLIVYDVLGRTVKVLINEKKAPGTYEIEFEGSSLASGVYFYRLEADGYSDFKKMVLIK
ncbi:MAG: T9SS type A sorting domain-containing protein [Chlorobi bacterium]|nr:T9SS type A sorting domain-containing protein [Chlorobiota bacterium]MCI0717329.1 T9SS type A sorting domain-containing protein [Chlorobiota bacterium]